MGLFVNLTDLLIAIFSLVGGIFYYLAEALLTGTVTSLIN